MMDIQNRATGGFKAMSTMKKTTLLRMDKSLYELVRIPASRHDSVWDITTGIDGTIYIGVSAEAIRGSSAKLFSYNPKTGKLEETADMGDVTGQKDPEACLQGKIHFGLNPSQNGCVYFSTHMGYHRDKFGWWRTWGSRHGYPGGYILLHDPFSKITKTLCMPYAHQGVYSMTLDDENKKLYGFSFPLGNFFAYDISRHRLTDYGRFEYNPPYSIKVGKNGLVYSTSYTGHFVCFDPVKERFYRMKSRIPMKKGQNSEDFRWAFSMEHAGSGNKLYGIGNRMFFEFDYEKDTCRSLTGHLDENISRYFRTESVLLRGNGWLYSSLLLGGEFSAYANIVALHPDSGDFVNFGYLSVGDKPLFKVYKGTQGLDGKLYYAGSPYDAEYEEKQLAAGKILARDFYLIIFSPPDEKEHDRYNVKKFPEAERGKGLYDAIKVIDHPKVEQGKITVVNVCDWAGKTPIPPENREKIASLHCADNGVIYGGTEGKGASVFACDPQDNNITVMHRFGQAAGIKALQWYDTGLYGILHSERRTTLFVIDVTTHTLKKERQLFGDQSISACIFDGRRNVLYGLTKEKGTFFAFDIAEDSLTLLDDFPSPCISRAMTLDGKGNVYTALGEENHMYCYFPAKKKLENLGIRIPVVKGRRYLNGIDSLVMTEENMMYGGTVADGFLFRFNIENNEIINLGKIAAEPGIPALVVLREKIYGVAGERNPQHLFVYDVSDGGFEDIGLLMGDPYTHIVQNQGAWKDFWKGYRFSCMTTGVDGKIYLGEYAEIPGIIVYEP